MDRTVVEFTVRMRLDPVPGWGDSPDHFQRAIEEALKQNIGHSYFVSVSEGTIVHEAAPLGNQLTELARQLLYAAPEDLCDCTDGRCVGINKELEVK